MSKFIMFKLLNKNTKLDSLTYKNTSKNDLKIVNYEDYYTVIDGYVEITSKSIEGLVPYVPDTIQFISELNAYEFLTNSFIIHLSKPIKFEDIQNSFILEPYSENDSSSIYIDINSTSKDNELIVVICNGYARLNTNHLYYVNDVISYIRAPSINIPYIIPPELNRLILEQQFGIVNN